MTRKVFVYLGWILILGAVIAYGIQIYAIQDLPRIEPWKWAIPGAGIFILFLSRDRQKVTDIHLPH